MSTIDPGMEDPLKEASQDVEGEVLDQQKDRDKEDEDDLMYPSTWWFASTACPLLAGTFGPIASGFNICALVYNWRVYVPPGGSETAGVRIEDPSWLIAVNAISLFSAVVGNATLLLNMARRLKFSIAQPITISGFLMGGVLLIADLAAINASEAYFITEARAIPDHAHALTSAYYYAIWAAAIYMIIGFLMCVTVFGANNGYYDKDFKLTPAQRTLMLQTMCFMAYLLLGALVFSTIEGWEYLDGVYWADVTLLTVGLGDYEPNTNVGRGLLFPFAIGGVLIIGLVVGSIRSLVLERGKEKMSARITEKRRESAIHHVNVRTQTIKVSWFARADFSTDPKLSPAQRREEEFKIMRKLQRAAERERRYFALFLSSSFALMLWFVGAAIFMVCESDQQWTYFESLYFSFVVLMTIGYGDFTPSSNSGRAFFVVWSLLAVPSLTILISNMGDTIVKWFSDFTIWVGSLTVLPDEGGVHASFNKFVKHILQQVNQISPRLTPPGIFGDIPSRGLHKEGFQMESSEHRNHFLNSISRRLELHIQEQELEEYEEAAAAGDTLQRDTHFYNYVLARELRKVQNDLGSSPPKLYTWTEWEYFLRIIGNEGESEKFPGQRHPDILVPDTLQIPRHATKNVSNPSISSSESDKGLPTSGHQQQQSTIAGSQITPSNAEEISTGNGKSAQDTHKPNGNIDQDPLQSWSWLSEKSPLMGSKSEAEWILERLSTALERELNRQRKGYTRKPPIGIRDAMRGQRDFQESKESNASDVK